MFVVVNEKKLKLNVLCTFVRLSVLAADVGDALTLIDDVSVTCTFRDVPSAV